MIARTRAKQRDVTDADAIEYLRKATDDTFGAITAIQFIEHLPDDALLDSFA